MFDDRRTMPASRPVRAGGVAVLACCGPLLATVRYNGTTGRP